MSIEKQYKLNELYGEENIVDANLFDDEDVIKLEELLNIYKKSSYWFHGDVNLKGVILRVSRTGETNTRLINILLYYMSKLSYFVFVRINDFGYEIICQCMDYLLSTVSSWVRNILIYNDYSENRKYHSLFNNVDYVLKNDEFMNIARAMIKEYYEDIMNSNLKPSIKGILIKRMINKYNNYSLPEQGFEYLNLVNDLNFNYIDLYVPQCPEYDLINKYVDFVNERMTDYNNNITMDLIMDFIGFYTFVEIHKFNMYDYKLYVMDNMFNRCLRYGIQLGYHFNTVYGPNWYLKM